MESNIKSEAKWHTQCMSKWFDNGNDNDDHDNNENNNDHDDDDNEDDKYNNNNCISIKRKFQMSVEIQCARALYSVH